MAYRRRYFEPFVGTTETIGDTSITEDKLVDKSVTERKIADDAITSEKIKDEEIKSEDIKDRTIEGKDIALNTLEGTHLKETTIPQSKLSFTPSARPLVPGASSAEIADGAVIESKYGADSIPATAYKPGSVDAAALAGDAVEEAKIKNEAVTGAKIKTSTITNLQMGVDSVRGSEIKDGEVSVDKLSTDAVETAKIKDANVTHDKLANDAVETVNVLDDNITTPKILDRNVTGLKLAKSSLREFLAITPLFYDDFEGVALKSIWASSGDAGGSAVVTAVGHNFNLKTGAVINDKYRVNFNGNKQLSTAGFFKMLWRVSLQATTQRKVEFGWIKNATNYVLFRYDSSVDGNWHAITRAGGAETDTDTGIAAIAGHKTFVIDWLGAASVKFYIGGVEEAENTTNVPTGIGEPQVELETLFAAQKFIYVDTYIHQEDWS